MYRYLLISLIFIFLFSVEIIAQSNKKNITLLGRWAHDTCNEVDVAGDTAYFIGDSSLKIVEFTDPSNPVKLGELKLEKGTAGIKVKEKFAYTTSDSTLYIIDVSNPENPSLASSINVYDGNDLVISDGYVYVAYSDYYFGGGVYIIDISDPLEPKEVGNFWSPGEAPDVAILDSNCYLIEYGDNYTYTPGLRVIDISEPSQPNQIAFCETANGGFNIDIHSEHAYMTCYMNGLRIIDISSPLNPIEKETYQMPETWDIAISEIYAYVSDNLIGVRILDLSSPAEPIEVGYYETAVPGKELAISGNKVYVAMRDSGLLVLRNDLISSIDSKDYINNPNFFMLMQNYPNPFNPTTKIKFTLPKAQNVMIDVYNQLGEKIRELVNREFAAGNHDILFNASDLASGIYYYRIESGIFIETKKMILLR